jgi:hypothetical protein
MFLARHCRLLLEKSKNSDLNNTKSGNTSWLLREFQTGLPSQTSSVAGFRPCFLGTVRGKKPKGRPLKQPKLESKRNLGCDCFVIELEKSIQSNPITKM